MLTTILEALGIIFMIIGLVFILYIIAERLFCKKGKGSCFTVLEGYGDDEWLPEAVYAAFIRNSFSGAPVRSEVIVLDYGVAETVKKSCREITGSDGSVVFCAPDDFSQIIAQLG